LHDRVFIIKLHSVVYHQFCSPALQDMLVYAWRKSGYVTKELNSGFRNVLQTLLQVNSSACEIEDCSEAAFLTCLYCSMGLCPNHFVVTPHYHR
jgi:hypothetical protein